MLHFWQYQRSSLENSATFFYNTCPNCQRFVDPVQAAAARPICIMNSYDWAEIVEHYYSGNPPYYELPAWDPLGCSYYNSK
jgi:hypothetical protein